MAIPSLGKLTSRLMHRVGDRAVHAFARVGYRSPHGDPARHGAELLADIPYRKTGLAAHTLDVYRPRDATGPAPVVFYVHGGGFAMLSKDTHRIMALAFARRGYVVVNINYRMGRRCPFPAPLEDTGAALLWTREHIAEHGGDPSRIVLAGESAGGNLVTATALCLAVDRPEPFARELRAAGIAPLGVMPIYGLLDVTDVGRFARKRKLPSYIEGQLLHAAESYVGDAARSNALRMPLASPLRVLEDLTPEAARELPPFFVAAGTKDPILDDSRRLDAALRRLGVSCELVVHPGEIHGYNVMLWRPAARDMWRRAHAFLSRVAPAERARPSRHPRAAG